MPAWSNLRSTRPSPGSWLAKRLEAKQPHPDVFLCGLRVVSGDVPGLTSRWKYRSAAVDTLVTDGVVTLNFGPRSAVRLRVDEDPMRQDIVTRPGMGVFAAHTADTGAELQVAAGLGELHRFGIDL